MKKIILSLVVIASVLTACKENKKEKVEVKKAVKVETAISKTNNIDVTASVLNWKGTKPGGAHNGTVTLKNSDILIEKGVLKGGEFVIDMTAIKCLDIPAEKEGNAKLVGHLSNTDFFDVVAYPTSKFVITKVENTDGKLAVTGNLQIKDVTKSITIPATISTQGGITTFTSEVFNVNRADFNIKYKSKSFFSLDELKDKFINDLIEFSFVVKTKA
jgi:polyisoprenoid-binding protein YceI